VKVSKPIRTIVLNRQDELKECIGPKQEAKDAVEKVLKIVKDSKF